jgi:hypothetical protein
VDAVGEDQVTRVALLVGLALTGVSTALSAQSYRTVVESRRLDGSGPLTVNVTFGVGELIVRPADGRQLYRMALTYAEDAFQPDVRFDADSRTLSIGMKGEQHRNLDLDGSEQVLDLALAREVPLDLLLTFGALEATVELGDLTLRSGTIKTGASETTVNFASPNRGTCDHLDFEVGAAEFKALGLANSRCATISLKGAVGEMLLDFSGEVLAAETRVFVKVGMGEVRLRLPEAVGVRLTADQFLASVSRAGLVKQGGSYVSPGFDQAQTKLVIDVTAALGNVEIERVR